MDAYEHQVGGHGLMRRSHSCPDRLFKPLALKEFAFYEALNSEKTPADLRALGEFVPRYYGVFKKTDMETEASNQGSKKAGVERGVQGQIPMMQINPSSCFSEEQQSWADWFNGMRYNSIDGIAKTSKPAGLYICMADVNVNWVQPCVLDIKVGTRHYDDDASEEKKARHMAKSRSSTTRTHGMRLCGMRTFNAVTKNFEKTGKLSQHELEPHAIPKHMRAFFSNGRCVRTDAIKPVVDRCKRLLELMSKQNTLSFYSSSLLIVYEGDEDASRKILAEGAHVAEVWMIDFAHTQPVKPDVPNDDGVVFGITSLVSFLEELLSSDHSNEGPLPTAQT